jgi:ABC-2 type transport system permease protein
VNRSAVAVILGAELRAWWNQVSKGRGGRTAGLTAVVALASIIFGGIVFAGGLAAAEFLPENRDAMLAGAFTALSVLMLVLGFPTVIGNFFVGTDLLQLVLAPIRNMDIFIARSLLAMRANVLLAGVVYAFLAGVGLGSNASPVYYVVGAVLLFLQVLAVTGLQVILMAAVLRFVPSRLARDVAVGVAGVAGAGLYLAWNVTLRGSFGGGSRPNVSSLVTLASRIDWLPSAWPGHALNAVIHGDVPGVAAWFFLFLALALVLTGASAALYGRTLLAGLGLLGSTPTLWKRRSRATPELVRSEASGAASPSLAIARKDWLAYRRDIRRLSRLLPGILFLVAYAFVLVRPTAGAGRFWSDVFLTAFISMFLAMAVAIAAVPGERRGFQLLRMAPISTWDILRAKILYTLSPAVALTALVSVVVAVTAGNGPMQVLQIALLAVWLGFGFVAVGVSAGAIDPRFDSVDDRRAVGVAGTFAGLGGELAFGALSVGGFALLTFAVDRPSFLPSGPALGLLLAVVAALFVVGAIGIVSGMLWLAARRLRTFEGAIGTAA